jgi:adenosylmethionine-8-amino-7-oxononanoate aminotransferase
MRSLTRLVCLPLLVGASVIGTTGDAEKGDCPPILKGTVPFFAPVKSPSHPDDLRCEYLINPLGIDVGNPRLSWKLPVELIATPYCFFMPSTWADGVHYWDVNGKRYLDALSGIYVVAVGHNNRRVIEAIHRQLDTLHFSPAMHGTNPVAIQLANVLAELAPGDLSTVKFQCGGSEVTEAALKLARQYHKRTGSPGKYKIIGRYLSWHGSTMGSLSASGIKSRKTVNEPLAPGFLHVFPPTCYRCPFGKKYPECGITCATIVNDVIEMEDPATVAAIMVEPIGHTGGIIDPPEEYLPLLREICDRHNILLIFDEIITGIGRTGRMFAAETFGVVPDVLCVGKGLGGGYAPLSAMICRPHRRGVLGTEHRKPGVCRRPYV